MTTNSYPINNSPVSALPLNLFCHFDGFETRDINVVVVVNQTCFATVRCSTGVISSMLSRHRYRSFLSIVVLSGLISL